MASALSHQESRRRRSLVRIRPNAKPYGQSRQGRALGRLLSVAFMSEIECEAKRQLLDRGSATIGDDDRLSQVQLTRPCIVTDDATSLGEAVPNSVLEREMLRAFGIPHILVLDLAQLFDVAWPNAVERSNQTVAEDTHAIAGEMA